MGLFRGSTGGYFMNLQFSRSYKNIYPFRIGAPSFVFPDDYVSNVKILGKYLDEIELLFMESTESSFPSKNTIKELSCLADDLGLTYNLHLPVDIYPGSKEISVRQHFVDTILRFMDIALPLDPTTHTLHLPYDESLNQKICDKAWIERISDSIRNLVASGITGHSLSIENTSYPLHWIEPVIREYGLRVCLDIGHLILIGENVEATYRHFEDITVLVHLHGVKNGKDHQYLGELGQDLLDKLFFFLKKYTGAVSVEVFSPDILISCLAELERNMNLNRHS